MIEEMTWKRAVVLLLIVWGLYVGRFWIGEPPFVAASGDDYPYLVAALNMKSPFLFSRDWGAQAITEVVGPIGWTKFLAVLVPLVGDLSLLQLALSSLLLLVFVSGIFTLVVGLTQQPVVALAAGLISLRPRMGFLSEWGVVLPHAQARTLVIALTPWVIWWTWRSRARFPTIALWSGILSVVHPLSGLHLLLLFAVQHVVLMGLSRKLFLDLLSGGALFCLGGLPTLLTSLPLVLDRPAPEWFIRFRTPYLLFEPRVLLGTLVYDLSIPILLLTWCWSRGRSYIKEDLLAWVRAGLVAVIAWTAVWIATMVGPVLIGLNLGRIGSYLHLFVLLVVVGTAWGLWTQRTLSHRLHAMALVGLLFAGSGTWWETALDRAQAKLGNPLGPRSAWLQWGRAPEPLPLVATIRPERDLPAFRELADWARRETPPGVLFLTPASDLGSFRIYARRAITLSYKDASMLIYSEVLAEEWYRQFREVVAAYASPNGRQLELLAKRIGASYILILTTGSEPCLSAPVSFENQRYRVYQVRSPL